MSDPRRKALGRILAVLALCLSLIVLHAPPGQARDVDVDLSRSVGPPTTPIRVAGEGFQAGEVVAVTFDGVLLANDDANPNGRVAAGLRIPSSALPGTHEIQLSGATSGRSGAATFTVRTDWPMFRGTPAHTGVNRFENVLDPSTVGDLELLWSAQTSDDIVWSGPAVVGDIAYILNDGGDAYAFDARSGQQIWVREGLASGFDSSPAVADGLVYADTNGSLLFALDAETGDTVWVKSLLGGQTSSPTVLDGIVYVGGDQLYALDALTGETIWDTYLKPGPLYTSPTLAGGMVFMTQVVIVHGLDAATGEIVWKRPTAGAVHKTPSVVDGTLYVTSTDGNIYALDAATGTLVWTVVLAEGGTGGPAVAEGALYFGSTDGSVYALDTADGEVLWSFPTGDTISISSPAVANGVVYIGSNDHKLYALNAATGELLWSYETGDWVQSSPAVADGRVYVGSRDGKLYAFGLPT